MHQPKLFSQKSRLVWLMAALAVIGLGALPAQAQPFAYAANNSDNTVSVIDVANNTVVATVPVGTSPFGIAITPDGAFAYVANENSDNVSVIATASNSVVATVPVGTFPGGVAITPNGAFAYVTNLATNDVSVIATASNTIVATVPVGTTPSGVAITPDGAFAYVANQNSYDVSVIATASNTVVATVTVGTTPSGVAITPDGAFVYVGTVYEASVIATASNTVVVTVPDIPDFHAGVAITPDGAFDYVTKFGTFNEFPAVLVIATASNTVVAAVPAANFGSNDVSVTATASNKDFKIAKAGESAKGAELASLPTAYTLEQNYPNPFNPETEIRFALPETGQVTVKIFNTTGQEVRTLANAPFQAGHQTLRWDGRDQSGNAVAAGVYLYQITARGANGEVKFSATKRMAFVK